MKFPTKSRNIFHHTLSMLRFEKVIAKSLVASFLEHSIVHNCAQFVQLAEYANCEEANGRRCPIATEPVEGPPVPPGRGPHVCSGASCYVWKNCFSFFNIFKIFVKIFVHNKIYWRVGGPRGPEAEGASNSLAPALPSEEPLPKKTNANFQWKNTVPIYGVSLAIASTDFTGQNVVGPTLVGPDSSRRRNQSRSSAPRFNHRFYTHARLVQSTKCQFFLVSRFCHSRHDSNVITLKSCTVWTAGHSVLIKPWNSITALINVVSRSQLMNEWMN